MTERRPASVGTIRRLVIGVLIATLVVPLVIVVAVEQLARSGRAAIAEATETAAREAAARADRPGERVATRDPRDVATGAQVDAGRAADERARAVASQAAAWKAIAARHEVRLWVIDPGADPRSPVTRFDSDQQPRRRSDLGMSGSIPSEPRRLDAFEETRAKPWQREHAVLAAQLGHSSGCATFADDTLLVCEAAVQAASGAVVLAQRAAPRMASRLVDARQGLLVLGGAVLVTGALFAAWLVRRLTGPLAALDRQVAARARGDQQTIAIAGAPREIAEVARAVDALAGKLEAQHRTQAAAAADLAHELKSPLARIKLALEAPPSARAALDEHARRAVVAIDRTVGDLLEIARAEAGLPGDERTAVDLTALARQVAADRPPPAGIALEVIGAPSDAWIAAAAVGRALGHLLDNAFAYAVARVTIEVTPGRIAVADDGPGVALDLQPRLFARFATRRAGGSGLGLAYVRAVAEAHGGAAALLPRGPGARFELRLA